MQRISGVEIVGVLLLILVGVFPDQTMAAALQFFNSSHTVGVNSAFYRTVNTESQYKKWNRTILFYLDSNYTAGEATIIHRAMAKISQDLSQCVIFQEVPQTDPAFKLKVTPLQAAPNQKHPEVFCYSYPGFVEQFAKNGSKEQRVSVTRGARGCLPTDGKLRGVMKELAHLLGKRNEHQRGDRDDYITVNMTNVLLENAYRHYPSTEAYWLAFPYDFHSITHNQPSDFALPGTVAFTVKHPPYTVPALDQLSVSDCRLISMMYGCDPSLCSALKVTIPYSNSTTPKPNIAAEHGHGAAATPNKHEIPHWGYRVHSSLDEVAPSDWSLVSSTCGAAHQSPIVIHTDKTNVKSELRQLNLANYDELPIGHEWTVVNNGHSVQFTAVFEDLPRLQGGSLKSDYDFIQFHFHWGSEDSRGSEHIINGETFPVELHIVHRKKNESDEEALRDPTGLAVLGIVFRVADSIKGKPDYSRHIDSMITAVQKVQKPMVPVTVVLPEFDLEDLIPDMVQYYRYSGSLTTPPCAEVVQWSVLKEPLLITEKQLRVFRSLRGNDGLEIKDNFRPLQTVNNRPIVLYPG